MYVIADNLTTTDPDVFGAATGGDRRWLEVRARQLVEAGADAIDLNASSLEGAEAHVLDWMAEIVEAVVEVPLSIDGPDLSTIVPIAGRRRCASIVNSWSVDRPIDDLLLAHAERPGTRVVVQLRDGERLPADARDRLAWAARARQQWEEHGIGADRLIFDMVALPWGADLAAGRGLLEAVAALSADQPELVTLVGLGNFGYGAADPLDAQRSWLAVLREAGLGAVLLDPTQPTLAPLWRG